MGALSYFLGLFAGDAPTESEPGVVYTDVDDIAIRGTAQAEENAPLWNDLTDPDDPTSLLSTLVVTDDEFEEFENKVMAFIEDPFSEMGDWFMDNLAPWFGDNANKAYNAIIHTFGTMMFGLTILSDRTHRSHYGTADIPRTPSLPAFAIKPFDLDLVVVPGITDFLDSSRIGPSVIGDEVDLFTCRVFGSTGMFGGSVDGRMFNLPINRTHRGGPEMMRVGLHWRSNIESEWKSQNVQQMGQHGQGSMISDTHLKVSPYISGVGGVLRYVVAESWDKRKRADVLYGDSPPYVSDWWDLASPGVVWY